MTIEEAKLDVKNLQDSIKKLLVDFEKKYGNDTIQSLGFGRWNGSNTAYGELTKVTINTKII